MAYIGFGNSSGGIDSTTGCAPVAAATGFETEEGAASALTSLSL